MQPEEMWLLLIKGYNKQTQVPSKDLGVELALQD
jgi:hypothetical protein